MVSAEAFLIISPVKVLLFPIIALGAGRRFRFFAPYGALQTISRTAASPDTRERINGGQLYGGCPPGPEFPEKKIADQTDGMAPPAKGGYA